jgi:hypothetical protein
MRQVNPRGFAEEACRFHANRARRLLFAKGDSMLQFAEITGVIDRSNSAGMNRNGLLTPKIASGFYAGPNGTADGRDGLRESLPVRELVKSRERSLVSP